MSQVARKKVAVRVWQSGIGIAKYAPTGPHPYATHPDLAQAVLRQRQHIAELEGR